MEDEVEFAEVLEMRKDVARDGVIYRAAAMPASYDDKARSARFVMSVEELDSYGDIVVQSGIDRSRFDKNPVALFGHRSWDAPIGTWSDIKTVRSSPKRTEGTLTFVEEGVDDVADRIAKHVKAGSLKACSIGFRGKKVERIRDDNDMWTGGYTFHEVELYECSVVTIPAVTNALVKGATEGADIVTPEVIEEFLEHLKAHPAVAKMVNRDLYHDVYREITGNKSISVGALELSVEGLERLEDIVKRAEKLSLKQASDEKDEKSEDEIIPDEDDEDEASAGNEDQKSDEEPQKQSVWQRLFGAVKTHTPEEAHPDIKKAIGDAEAQDKARVAYERIQRTLAEARAA